MVKLSGSLILLLLYGVFCCNRDDATCGDIAGQSNEAKRENSNVNSALSAQRMDINVKTEPLNFTNSPVGGTILDISQSTKQNVLPEEFSTDKTKNSFSRVNDEFVISKITDRENEVWKGPLEAACKAVSAFTNNTYLLLTTLLVDLCGGNNRERERDGYISSGKLCGYKLDIEHPNLAFVSTTERGTREFIRMRYIANPGVKITAVLAGDFLFWESDGNQSLELCNERTMVNQSLLHLRTYDLGSATNLFYEKFDGSWTIITEKEHSVKLDEMKKKAKLQKSGPYSKVCARAPCENISTPNLEG
ncbi:signal peptide containing protein [Theileria equi strain WA]|uniref:Signal peptide containing protein n=1 Tax=Theileria equi strain WA TaxID=1537102 RepID=L1LAK7_THEEQ|nr:signal peptide containing protein [Theileria equi strain WA]EKX72274.1 signal peptide containing protein [Theileria equi strain WA]|eukprot:XP_004831726.1 signal peptide containing protein [Theileria equi strain WA]